MYVVPCISSVLCCALCLAPAAASGFSLLRNPDDFLGSIDNMDTGDGGKKLFFRCLLFTFSDC